MTFHCCTSKADYLNIESNCAVVHIQQTGRHFSNERKRSVKSIHYTRTAWNELAVTISSFAWRVLGKECHELIPPHLEIHAPPPRRPDVHRLLSSWDGGGAPSWGVQARTREVPQIPGREEGPGNLLVPLCSSRSNCGVAGAPEKRKGRGPRWKMERFRTAPAPSPQAGPELVL